eukprot:scaffold129030_cov17-Tisochrysis_lutea.AAC.1
MDLLGLCAYHVSFWQVQSGSGRSSACHGLVLFLPCSAMCLAPFGLCVVQPRARLPHGPEFFFILLAYNNGQLLGHAPDAVDQSCGDACDRKLRMCLHTVCAQDKCYGFVTLSSSQAAQHAIQTLNGQMVSGGQTLRVNYAL